MDLSTDPSNHAGGAGYRGVVVVTWGDFSPSVSPTPSSTPSPLLLVQLLQAHSLHHLVKVNLSLLQLVKVNLNLSLNQLVKSIL